MLNPLVASIATQLAAMQARQKNIALAQMANDVRLLSYLAQLIIRSVPSVKDSAILLGSTGRRCSGSLTYRGAYNI